MQKTIIARAVAVVFSLFVFASSTNAQQGTSAAKASSTRSATSRVQGFNIVLVLGDLNAAATAPETVPAAARKALADMKDFLPYKSYRLLDTSWILSDNSSAHATSRLRGPGPEDHDYQISLEASPETTSGAPLRVSFSLTDPRRTDVAEPRPSAGARRSLPTGKAESETPSLDHMKAEIERRVQEIQRMQNNAQRLSEAHPSSARGQEEIRRAFEALADVQRRAGVTAAPPLKLIETGFTMDVGETVVVGTSRVGGDKAIIVLLTAVARGTRR